MKVKVNAGAPLTSNAPLSSVEEQALRHSAELPCFVVAVLFNFLLMALAIALILHPPVWDRTHPIIGKEISLLRLLAFSALVGIPGAVLIRNRRRALVIGSSVRFSDTQFPEIYSLLVEQCRRIGMAELPELYLTSSTIETLSAAFSSWRTNYIVLHQTILDVDYRKSLDIAGFAIGQQLGAIRLGHTAWWNDMLLTYVSALKWPAYPLERMRVYSRDRYGAYLAPTGFRGLLIYATGRRLMDSVNIDDYLEQVNQYEGTWSRVALFTRRMPPVFLRLRELKRAGYNLQPPDVTDRR